MGDPVEAVEAYTTLVHRLQEGEGYYDRDRECKLADLRTGVCNAINTTQSYNVCMYYYRSH
eukprot:m.44442 g.44442  ORF g.44442 m.44442 type:complete len:61 (-) comp10095_c0_seq2:666-848(-)